MNSTNSTLVKDKRIKDSGKFKSMIQRLGRGLMLPIAILPIAGLFLGVGSGINNALIAASITQTNALIIGNVMISIGNVVFGNLPILFAIAIAITFTDDAGAAGLAAFVGWLVFNAIQVPFINVNDTSANIFFYHNISLSLLTSNVGIQSLNTSVFGGILIGSLTAYLYNKFHKINLPSVIGFFSGVRFIPIITFLFASVLGLLFLLIWPLISQGITALGTGINSLPIGLNAFFFGIIERALIPFGLHHVFYTSLWYTSAGATLDLTQIYLNGTQISQLPGITSSIVVGDQSIWMFLNSTPYLSFDQIYHVSHHLNDGLTSYQNLTWDPSAITVNYNPGQYMQGKFTIMIFGLPAAGAAMIMCSKKENRQVAMSVIGAAAFTSLLTGITEPIEFTFLFLAPILFFGFHVFMAGMSFWILNVLGAHVGLTFSGGLIDLVIYGLIPSVTNNPTHFWYILILGVIYIPIYYFVFYFYIKKFNIMTPGRGDAEVKMLSKADYQQKSNDPNSSQNEQSELTRLEKLIVYLGGMDNLKTIDACATRLRLTVNNRELIKDAELKSLGAAGIAGKGNNVQVIFGGEADIFKTELKEVLSGKTKINTQEIERQINLLNNLDSTNYSEVSSELTRLEKLIVYLGGMDNLKTIDACATRLRLTVNNRELIKDAELKSLGAAGIAGKGNNVQVIFGGEADIFKTELKEVLSGKTKINTQEIERQINLLNKQIESEKPEDKIIEQTIEFNQQETQIQNKSETKETKLKAEKKSEQKAKNKIEQEVKLKAEQEAEQKAKLKSEQEAKIKSEKEAKIKAEQEAKNKIEQEAKIKAEQEAEQKNKNKIEQEAKLKADEKAKFEQESKIKAEQEAKNKAKLKAEKEVKEAKLKAEQEAKNKIKQQEEINENISEDKTIIKNYASSKELFSQTDQLITQKDKDLALELFNIFGGQNNIEKISGNITRISVKLKDRKIMNQEELMKLPIKNIVGNSNNFQIIWNNEVEGITKALQELL